ncbi:hypothetical protein Rhe02_08470 [Rhizocola hellebori]|uniref:Uncharacterized protein n=1 Tax=Rhizocola hellebori TaxID=1392758 RepID=A0A8J3Q3X3_9ACTN|nr:hypothetical protein [Rhizocola hellebori]GIH02780.1 hypothetical protein Rhe02_08470 [Rhizocola hellebori]
MKLDGLAATQDGAFSGRFFLVSYLPTSALALFVIVLVWAGAPSEKVNFAQAWTVAAALKPGQLVLLGLGLLLAALLLHPFQPLMVGILAGRWPSWLGPLARLSGRLQTRRYRRLAKRAELPDDPQQISDAQLQELGVAGATLRQRYPRADRIQATALGNALAAAWDAQRYGWDTATAWPRLYPILSEPVKILVNDDRNLMDTAARVSMTAAAASVLSGLLLARSGWWLLLTLVPLTLARLAYLAAVRAAVMSGQAIQVAFDLHRFDLMTALHLPMPDSDVQEHEIARAWCDWWRQGLAPQTGYQHPQ